MTDLMAMSEAVEEFLIRLDDARKNNTCCAKHRNAAMARVAETLESKLEKPR
ncbi:hypothetical protein SEA_KABOCHA_8 [Gordonia phage Kabocha]|uniref:Uncharacterized protein n=1 Tax=Gordonia phage Chidiebere TaxID=2656530 RepID=A0A649VKH6_9CAUD|nr:hypothetical protein PQD14_gp008 [Gordonia phage Chidiebere]AZS07863.1 hypothetical protein PBI_GRAY_8 [Gordonia phage Gray]WAA19795.1 hypothetical protein SEA_KABOCHA_8 [Gordonia phage Kabocha]WAA19986.1 hypothetical protein SEA_HANEM_8 [Gordonia phage Hanem]WNM67029.1 hypothetical protein SEA_SCHOMBER_8 [Gordonia Phage Schomber]QGJ92900.1 hypothetical protein PBI_CHIDIEBERE_8 [Gordonia phage Chidiebere]